MSYAQSHSIVRKNATILDNVQYKKEAVTIMRSSLNVTLQINLAPSDWPHARYILPHQLRQFAGQTSEVVLTLDLHRSSGRFSEGWQERLPKIKNLIKDCCSRYPHARLQIVDYTPESIEEVSKAFFKGIIPPKDFRGGPFYSYFSGLHSAKHNYVLHLDSDLMFGGCSQFWVAEAVSLLKQQNDVLVCGPLPGPPTRDRTLRSQTAQPYYKAASVAFSFSDLSTRYFLLDKEKLATRVGMLPLERSSVRNTVKALVEGNYPYQLPEEILTGAMHQHDLKRVEFLGEASGMWSLHPPYRTQQFYKDLPEIIQKIEADNIPDAQRGCHDLNESLVDWQEARLALARNRWWKRLAKRNKIKSLSSKWSYGK